MPKKKKITEKKTSKNKGGGVRVRFAPAPTGPFHIGNARTALFNYLFAKKNKGELILRLEDTDIGRSGKNFEEDIMENLRWLGIDWDEGPVFDKPNDLGERGPYRQSARMEIYRKYIQKLFDEGRAYYCFCSEEELEIQKQYQLSQGLAPKYSGRCAGLFKDEIKESWAKNKTVLIRFTTPSVKLSFIDLIRGKIEFDSGLLGDFPIAKALPLGGTGEKERKIIPLYNFAVVVDDFEMKLTHIIRGEDLLPNMPKQILLQKALGFEHPQYGHLPLILGADRSKLSKRHGALAISDYKKQGYLPEALVNQLALLGWNPGDNREFLTMKELIKEFSIERTQKSGAIFNIDKLNHFNAHYLKAKSAEDLTELSLPYLLNAGLVDSTTPKEYIRKVVSVSRDRLKKLSDIAELSDYFFRSKLNYEKEMFRWKRVGDKELLEIMNVLEEIISGIGEKKFSQKNIEKILIKKSLEFAEKKFNREDRGYLLWPLRVALSAKKASASPFEIAEALGKTKTLNRIREAKMFLTNGRLV